jgi:N-acetyl-gamma-glutamyl-phosphate reductase
MPYDHALMVRAGIIGASGYTGAELLRLLAGHPDMELVVATADSNAGGAAVDLYPSLAAAYPGLTFESFDITGVADARLDVAFLGLPHQASMALVPQLAGMVSCIVDLSAAFRLKDAALYPTWYGFDHDQPELLAGAVYGLPERTRKDLPGASLVATPGCYVTAATLALAPLLDAGVIARTGIIVDAASGVTGAGRVPTATNAFCTVDENFTAYGLLDHRHTPEIEQNLDAQVLFTPHLAPMNRGILATCYSRPADGVSVSTDSLLADLEAAYAGEPFVVVTASSPSTKATLGSNTAVVSARYDGRTGYVVTLCAIDNLTKGASGGALQAANVALGLEETAGLPTVGLMP